MNQKENLKALVEYAVKHESHIHMRSVIEKELLHYDILFALDKENLLDTLTFQGGTSLRLCYGSNRFSEDLDFVGGENFNTMQLIDIKQCIEHYIGHRYDLTVSVKEPKEMQSDLKSHDIKVDKWQVCVITAPEKKDLPQQKIKIEVINIPSYSRIPKPLHKNYDFLPDGYSEMLIMVETLEEIMADKIISFVNCQKYIRHRDIWDLHWIKQKGTMVNFEYINNKINDYKISDYPIRLDLMLSRLDDIIYGKHFSDEMSRFIPLDVQERTLKKSKFLSFLATETKDLLQEVKRKIAK